MQETRWSLKAGRWTWMPRNFFGAGTGGGWGGYTVDHPMPPCAIFHERGDTRDKVHSQEKHVCTHARLRPHTQAPLSHLMFTLNIPLSLLVTTAYF